MTRKTQILYKLSLLLLVLIISCQHKGSTTLIDDNKAQAIVDSAYKKNVPTQIKIYDSILKFHSKELSPYSKGLLTFELANSYLIKQDFKKALLTFQKALKIFQNIKDKESIGKTYVNIGIVLADLNQKKQSLDNIYKAIKIAKEIHNKRIESRAYGELAHTYYMFGDFDNSIKFLEKILVIQKQQKDSLGLSGTYQNLGILYAQKNENKKAYELMYKAMILDSLRNDQIALANSYNNLASMALRLHKNHDTIISYFNRSVKILKKNDMPIVDEYINMGETYFDNENYNEAKRYYLQALNNAKNKKDSIDVYVRLINVAVANKNSDLMYDLFQKKDSLWQALKEIEKKESIQLLNENHKLNLNKINSGVEQKIFRKNMYFFIIFLFLLLFLGIMLGLIYKNKALKTQKEKLELERKVLRSQLNPHFIFNSLTALQNSLILESPIHAISYISRFAKLIRKVFQYLNKKYVNLKEEIDLLEEYAEMQNIRRENKIKLEVNIDADLDLYNVKIPPLLLQPIIENSFEHGFGNLKGEGKIEVNISKKNRQICYEIKDNGKPVKPNDPDDREHALDILKRRIDLFNKKNQNNFRIDITPQGTKVNFCIDMISIYS